MIGWVVVMEPADYQRLARGAGRPGRRWPARASSCSASSAAAAATAANATVRAPLLDGVYGHPVPLAGTGDGSSRPTSAYIRDSILLPKAQVVAGYEPVMPTFQGQISEDELLKIIAYIKSLGKNERARAMSAVSDGIEPARTNYLNAGYGVKSWLLTTDHKRIAMLYMVSITLFFFVGGAAATLMRLELMTPPGRRRPARDVQQAVHAARRDHGLLLPDPVDPGGAGQLPDPADDRGPRPGLPQAEPAELVHLHARRRCSRSGRR